MVSAAESGVLGSAPVDVGPWLSAGGVAYGVSTFALLSGAVLVAFSPSGSACRLGAASEPAVRGCWRLGRSSADRCVQFALRSAGCVMSETPVQSRLPGSGPGLAERHYVLPVSGSGLRYVRDWLSEEDMRRLESECDALAKSPDGGWRPRAEFRLYGRRIVRPRDTVWMSQNRRSYSYGGTTDESVGWPPWVRELAGKVAEHPAWRFPGAPGTVPNVALLNVYRNGRDHVDWHADDEREIDQRSPIASVSLGAVRTFRIRRASGPAVGSGVRTSERLALGSGSLLVMPPGFQADWEHRIPPAKDAGRRWNLTFRVYGRPS